MKHILILFLAFALSGCGGRQFVPEWDTGYEVTEEADEISTETALYTSSVVVGVAGGLLIPGSLVAVAALPAAQFGAVAATCPLYKCWKHVPYDDILMSGNALRGQTQHHWLWFSKGDDAGRELFYEEYPEHRAFEHPGKTAVVGYPNIISGYYNKWGNESLFAESLGLQRGDLVDVYVPHMPDLERRAIVDALIYPGIVVHIVCKYDDDDCFDKFEREDDNFILGRWKTVDEFKAAFEENEGFPNP